MTRLAIMAHYDPLGMLGPHARRQVDALAAAVDDLVVVSTASLSDTDRTWLAERGRVIQRENLGYDFYSYKTGLDASPNLGDHDEVVLCNDTYVPVQSYAEMFATMSDRPVDFWGLSGSHRVSPHLQSFFIAFRPWVVNSHAFRQFWGAMLPVSKRGRVIRRYEVGLTAKLSAAGFCWEPYFRETPSDIRLAKRRVAWWALRRRPMPRSRQEAKDLLELAQQPWNPAAALADIALDGGRLPYVKLDTLRHDPYGLNSERLLTLCERRLPESFAGMREYLATTAGSYPARELEILRPLPRSLRPFRRLVEYGCAL